MVANAPALKTALHTTKNTNTATTNSNELPLNPNLSPNLSSNIMQVQVQSTASKEWTIENNDFVKSEVSDK